ncbi:hypothetical protein [Rathayibacter rathayi]|uniref:Uncharacterized protein n=1 Tax=Rathayibacter rathayi TaxID=33887 RepID=A0ABX5AAP4_RATRA|nr:hypothetical protein [Rathayibacter rathayi]AZZ49491.1 hypothetical protein C1O28_10035 [Rathayibacter rathayi]MWV73602.1 hypothetical protein [Rathayibacter rathayi NCPPB 2980 = VKM Ac-1601]PPF22880.1 hypothetical protein C5C34_10825 [Rathayibacter rathayi]PPF47820.1 hypothetical protein C5C08_10570 [Rathayibacter rathayi]PPG67002.1 hypothetical protein C5C16_10115 [Rathayibacter rathayi]
MSGWSVLEIVGALVVALALIGLAVAAVAVGAGDEIAFVGVLVAFAVGVTGLGLHIAGREARYRRDNR